MKSGKRKIDMLSGLPDYVLHDILSFLPTRTSVSTIVLAKRWRFLWTHVPNLQFDGDNFKVGSKTQYIDIINRVIMLHEAKIVIVFRLSNVKGCAYQLETLIIYPIKRGVQNLCLEFDFKDEEDIVCTVPRLIFICKTLVDLKLVCCGVIPSGGELFLPSLKKLNLSYVEYESDESLPHLLSRCPVLEELIVKVCLRQKQNNTSCIIVSSSTIKKLIVDFSNLNYEFPDEMLIIDVPALVYLKVDHCNLDSVKSLKKTMTSLIEADFTLNGCSHTCGTDCTKHGRSVEFLSCLCRVRYLRISSDFAEMLVDIVGTGSTVKFDNLSKLELDLTVDWYKVIKLLEVADNLEVLIIHGTMTTTCNEPKRVPSFMLSRLRIVRISYFSAWEDSFDVVRYILRNAQVLERMEIDPLKHIFSANDKLIDALRRILLFERGSLSRASLPSTHIKSSPT